MQLLLQVASCTRGDMGAKAGLDMEKRPVRCSLCQSRQSESPPGSIGLPSVDFIRALGHKLHDQVDQLFLANTLCMKHSLSLTGWM